MLKKIKIQMDNFGHCCPNNNLTSSTALKRKLWGTFSFNQSEETLICWRFDSNVAIFHTNRLATLLCHIFCRYETAVYFDQCIHVKCGLGEEKQDETSELWTAWGHVLILCGLFYHHLKASIESILFNQEVGSMFCCCLFDRLTHYWPRKAKVQPGGEIVGNTRGRKG